eukprot:5034679-Alexandrium_andersonii.AAC.1
MLIGSGPNLRTVWTPPIPGDSARLHARTASGPRPGRLVDGVLGAVGVPVDDGVLGAIGVPAGADRLPRGLVDG